MEKMFSRIIYERGKVSTIWLNRPDVRNAMDDVLIAELTRAFEMVAGDNSARVAVLRGKGKSFCAGADLNYMKNIAGYGFRENVEDGRKLAELFRSVYECPVPSIAVVHGAAFGGANGLLAACDIVLAEDQATFAFSEVRLGIAAATIAPFVIRRIGEAGARELMVTGKRFNGTEAEKWHLVNHAVPHDNLETTLQQIVGEILKSAPEAVRETKRLIREVTDQPGITEELIESTVRKIAELRASPEGQEGMAAFLEKRKAKWTD